MIPLDLHYFVPSEFKNPDLVDAAAAYWLDALRGRYGAPLVVTSDARTSEENDAVGGSPTSLHLLGRAFDLKWIDDEVALWSFVRAVFDTSRSLGAGVELELVHGATDHHMHVGIFADRRPSRLLVQAD